ncbi:MAG: glycosyltransferase family 2 protein [Bacteroidales bacterium]|nr:glycosyltransferase family 2 protein [Bacteroidales bacterium]
MIKISIISPAYNASKTVRKCIESILHQTYTNWELVVVDDGSTDETDRIVNEYAQLDQRVTLIKQQNAGPGMARNKGIEYVTNRDCDYIAFIDSDDYIESDYLSLVVKKIHETDCDIVVLDNYFETPEGVVIKEERLSLYKSLRKNDIIACQMTGKLPWGGWRKVFKKSIIFDNHIRYSHDAVGEEAIFSFQCFYYARNIEFLGKSVYHYVDQPYSQSKKGADNPWGQVALNMKCFLESKGLYESFELPSNSFLITALMVSFYRVSLNHSYKKAREIIKNKIKHNQNLFRVRFDKKCMEAKTMVLFLLSKLGMIDIIILLSRIKSK